MRTRSLIVLAAGAAVAVGVAVPSLAHRASPKPGPTSRVAAAPASAGPSRGTPTRVAAPAAPRSTATRTAAGATVDCVGAAALAAGPACPLSRSGRLTPSAADAPTDLSDAYHGGRSGNCFAYQPYFRLRVCTFGDKSATTKVALVGNSHAGQWLPALQVAARMFHWKIVTYLASQCVYGETAQRFLTTTGTRNCSNWVRTVETRLARTGFRLIVMTNRLSVAAVGATTVQGGVPAYLRGETAVLRKLHREHKLVYAIRDTPAPRFGVPACLAAHRRNFLACAGTPARWLPPDPVYRAAAAIGDPRIHAANLTRYICTATLCPAVVGGVIVYRDSTHLTATYNRTIGPFLAARLQSFLAANP